MRFYIFDAWYLRDAGQEVISNCFLWEKAHSGMLGTLFVPGWRKITLMNVNGMLIVQENQVLTANPSEVCGMLVSEAVARGNEYEP